MARRRFQDTRPLTNEQGLLALILMGMGLTIGGVVATCFLALNEGANQGAELWLPASCLFRVGSNSVLSSRHLLISPVGLPLGTANRLFHDPKSFLDDKPPTQQQHPS